jgi:hypothetical protein
LQSRGPLSLARNLLNPDLPTGPVVIGANATYHHGGRIAAKLAAAVVACCICRRTHPAYPHPACTELGLAQMSHSPGYPTLIPLRQAMESVPKEAVT